MIKPRRDRAALAAAIERHKLGDEDHDISLGWKMDDRERDPFLRTEQTGGYIICLRTEHTPLW